MGSPHRYLPNTTQDVAKMLDDIGASSVDDLFSVIPPEYRVTEPLICRRPLRTGAFGRAEQGAAKCAHSMQYTTYLGGGLYEHFVPSVVRHMLTRGEF